MQGNYSDLLVVLSGVYSQLRGDEKAAEAEKEESSQVTHMRSCLCAPRAALCGGPVHRVGEQVGAAAIFARSSL